MISEIDPLGYIGWDDLVGKFENNTIFHTSYWASVMKKVYGYTPLYFIWKEEEEITGIMPFMEVKSFITGKRGISLPFTDGCIPLVKNGQVFLAMMEEIRRYAREEQWKYVEFRDGGEYFNKNINPSAVYYSHEMKVEAGGEDLLSLLKSSTKRNIKKSIKEGTYCEISSSENAIEEFYKLHCITRKRHGLPPQPVNFFRSLQQEVIGKGQGYIVNTKYEGQVIASGIFLHYGNKCFYKYGASDLDFNEKRPNYAMFFHAISEAYRKGLTIIDFGRTDIKNEGLRNFKMKWKAEEKIINYFRYNIRQEKYEDLVIPIKGIHNLFFRNMPCALLQLTGRLAYKHIA